ncbi:hypothetical protein HJB72_05625 [Rhizobium lentis]|uniref:hypothetical protein n=1 Tax=Rhizobium lentis TaxID=1138194 RepID=UPI001C82FCDB|nr:hypothetical protein [Rhizobium lentis]MBX4997468.1 hypothetical protein [Rhizobium lentis]
MVIVSRGPRIGSRANQPQRIPFPEPIAPHPYNTEYARELALDFEEFADCSLIYLNASEIRDEFLKGKNLKKEKKKIRVVRDFVRYYEQKNNITVASSENVNVSFCVDYIVYCINRFKSPATIIRFCWRLLRVIGVSPDIIPPNPTRDTAIDAREELDAQSARNFLNMAKQEARVIIDRFHQVEQMNSRGRDPRLAAGARLGAWDQLENRLWICRELLGLQARTEKDLIEAGHRNIIRSMEKRSGAAVIDPVRGVVQQRGLLAHLRFYHPSVADLAPFIALLLIRSNVNLQTVADLQVSSRWWEPYPRAFSHEEEPERWVSIILPKLRGTQGVRRKRIDKTKVGKVDAKSPGRIRIPSLKRPWSHPFQVLTFVQNMTQPLRTEIKRRIGELSAKADRTEQERRELDRLQFIKDDMFVYRSEQEVTSLKFVTREQQITPRPLVEVLKRYGLSAGVKQLRDVGLQFGFRASGNNLLILHLLARHSSRETAAVYARRREFFRRSEELFIAIFEKSVALVRSSSYSIANLRAELRSSGLEDWQITNILNPDNRSRYGNRCGGPYSPPEPFNKGTPPGQLCRSQDCIDGCPLARFLPDALPFLVKQWNSIKQQLSNVGIAAAFDNSLQHRLQRLERILDKYPRQAVLAEKKKLATEEGGNG